MEKSVEFVLTREHLLLVLDKWFVQINIIILWEESGHLVLGNFTQNLVSQ